MKHSLLISLLFIVSISIYADDADTTASGTVDNTISIVESSLANIDLGSSIDVVNGAFSSKTTTFTIKANSNSTTYNVWLTASNYDSTNSIVYASNGSYRLPVEVTLTGTTTDTGIDGVLGSGGGSPVVVSRTISENSNSQRGLNGAGKSAGEDVWGTNVNGTVYTITIDQIPLVNYPASSSYNDIPSGTYSVTISAHALVTN